MKKLIPLMLLTLTGCTTTYKVDSKGVCRASNGSVVNIENVDPYSYKEYKNKNRVSVGDPSSGANFTINRMRFLLKVQTSSTAYGW